MLPNMTTTTTATPHDAVEAALPLPTFEDVPPPLPKTPHVHVLCLDSGRAALDPAFFATLTGEAVVSSVHGLPPPTFQLQTILPIPPFLAVDADADLNVNAHPRGGKRRKSVKWSRDELSKWLLCWYGNLNDVLRCHKRALRHAGRMEAPVPLTLVCWYVDTCVRAWKPPSFRGV